MVEKTCRDGASKNILVKLVNFDNFGACPPHVEPHPTYGWTMSGDNKSVLCNASVPDSTLKKKSQSIAYHFVREGSARDEWRVTYINTHDNESHLLTKVLPSGEREEEGIRAESPSSCLWEGGSCGLEVLSPRVEYGWLACHDLTTRGSVE